MNKDIQITIFTPTYNRAYIISNLYNSLCKQTNSNFVWLIVDDGSTDNTKELISKWQDENKININYIYQENGGKMRAYNKAVANATTELFCCIDSDDYIVENAIEIILENWNKITNKDNLSGIVAYRGDKNLKPISTIFPEDVERTTIVNLTRNGFKGDTTLVNRTEVLRKYPFPEIEGEKFITEGYVFHQMDMSYYLYIVREVLTICEYLQDGYTRNEKKLAYTSPKGFALYYDQEAELSINLKEYFVNKSYAYCFKMYTHQKIDIKFDKKIVTNFLCLIYGTILFVDMKINK